MGTSGRVAIRKRLARGSSCACGGLDARQTTSVIQRDCGIEAAILILGSTLVLPHNDSNEINLLCLLLSQSLRRVLVSG